jgi:hypothetical protein
MSLKPLRNSKVDEDKQKREFTIPPVKIDKQLITELGEFLEQQQTPRLILTYRLNSETKTVAKQNVRDFVSSDWGTGLKAIIINSKSLVRIKLKLSSPTDSKCSVVGKDLTKVNGVKNSLWEIFQRHKLAYASVKTRWVIKISVPLLLSLILVYPIFLFLNSVYSTNSFMNSAIPLSLVIGMFLGAGLYGFVQWLFPFFEYGNPTQKSVRKWIWFVLIGSGFIPTILLKFLGF